MDGKFIPQNTNKNIFFIYKNESRLKYKSNKKSLFDFVNFLLYLYTTKSVKKKI